MPHTLSLTHTHTYQQVFDEELRGDHLSLEFQVSLEIQEEDSKGVFSSVNMEKDCFKLRQQARRRLTLTVSQPSAERSLLIMRYATGSVH